jgi:hypothetical protein
VKSRLNAESACASIIVRQTSRDTFQFTLATIINQRISISDAENDLSKVGKEESNEGREK